MKVIFAIVGLLIMLFYTAGYYFVFYFEHQQIRQKVQSDLKSENFSARAVTLYFSNDEFSNVRINSSELFFSGFLFDILSVKKVGDKIIVNCVQDEKESSLLESLASYFDMDNNSSGETDSSTSQLINFLQMPFLPSLADLFGADETAYRQIPYHSVMYHSPLAANISPPPKKICS